MIVQVGDDLIGPRSGKTQLFINVVVPQGKPSSQSWKSISPEILHLREYGCLSPTQTSIVDAVKLVSKEIEQLVES